ncbi:PREDICTED: uncharacterized protein LOC108759603 [Trachymyrmex cornetzi]|uniref:uncharacterized protein LOC108759603 n=1 Tax=Trachymyrmex cornetzi TaxID=471704 RepID=UPI00084EF74F|nr:PREDICTED: uncharacterized protein LOC108759603 [Trachymyrmex cornetzi]
MDGTGFSTVPTKIGKVIAVRGIKKVGLMSSAERGRMITMTLTVNAEGNSIPPYFLFPTKKMQCCYMDDASPGAVGFANESGWMCQPDFVKYMKHFIERSNSSLANPTLLLIDNHSSHLSVEVLDMAKNNANKVIEIRHIASLVQKALDLALTPRNIKAGFQATGISPFNPNVFTDSDFVQAVVDGENDKVIAAESEESNMELQRRILINVPEIVAHEETSTSKTSSTMSSILSSVGPLCASTPGKKCNREPETNEEVRFNIVGKYLRSERKGKKKLVAKEKATANKEKRLLKRKQPASKESARKQPAKKREKKKSTSSSSSEDDDDDHDDDDDEDVDFCIICMKNMPRKPTRYNSVECNTCKRAVHLKCANMRTSFFTCANCDSD